jgi:myo-inositol-1(or 4)-monophosphatase
MDEITIAVNTALEAGEIIRKAWGREDVQVFEKGSAINPVTEVDRQCEDLIKRRLAAAFPEYGILAEESDKEKIGSGARWIVDPIDGTTNFIRRYPLVAVSIGLEVAEKLVLGVVYNPIMEELFVGQTGGGATLNGKPLRVTETRSLERAVLASGFPYDAWENPDNNTREWAHFVSKVRSLRCDGSAALDVCYVGAGRLDGYWEKGVSPWDIAAGIVIAREAGALVTDYGGGEGYLASGEVIAANPVLHSLVMKELTALR